MAEKLDAIKKSSVMRRDGTSILDSHVTSRKTPRPLSVILLFIVVCLSYNIPYLLSKVGCDILQDLGNSSLHHRADDIARSSPVVDGHNDLLIRLRLAYGNDLNNKTFQKQFEHGGLSGQVDLPRMDQGHYSGAFWSAWYFCPSDPLDFSVESYDPIVRATYQQLDLYHRLAALYPDYFPASPPSNPKDALRDLKEHLIVSPLAIEGLHQIGNSLANLRLMHKLGVRYATLTWNCHNIYADAAVLTYRGDGVSKKSTPYWGGVSKVGRNAILEMNRLGMLVDLAHVSPDTMQDVLIGQHNDAAQPPDKHQHNAIGEEDDGWDGSLAPPVFSHSSAYALCPHPRNVPDHILPLVKRRNSVIMINVSPDFISCEPANSSDPLALPTVYAPNNTLHQVVRHMVYIGRKIGWAHVGLGTDFDGIEDVPRGFEDVSKIPDLVAEMLSQGVGLDSDGNPPEHHGCGGVVGRIRRMFTSRAGRVARAQEHAIKGILGANVLRLWAEVDRVGERLRRSGMLPVQDPNPGFPGVVDTDERVIRL